MSSGKKNSFIENVPFIRFGELIEKNLGGGTPSKDNSNFWNGNIPWASVKDIVKSGQYIADTQDHITDLGLEKSNSNLIPENWLLFCTRINPGICSITTKPIAINQDLRALKLKSNIDIVYLWHFLKTLRIEGTGSTVKGISIEYLNNLLIPLPELHVQKKIAEKLDAFTILKAELEAELETRILQYDYYRDTLIQKMDHGSKVRFGEVAQIQRGASPRPIANFITSKHDGIPWIRIGDVEAGSKYVNSADQKITPEGATRSRLVHKGDFILSNSMSFGRPYILNIEGCIHDGWLSISGYEESYDSSFLYHLIRSRPVQRYFEQKASNSTVRNLNADIVKELILPLPNLNLQRQTASLLDRFETIVNDVKTGLPAEIAARQKQYEYYRDKLLTFKEKAA